MTNLGNRLKNCERVRTWSQPAAHPAAMAASSTWEANPTDGTSMSARASVTPGRERSTTTRSAPVLARSAGSLTKITSVAGATSRDRSIRSGTKATTRRGETSSTGRSSVNAHQVSDR